MKRISALLFLLVFFALSFEIVHMCSEYYEPSLTVFGESDCLKIYSKNDCFAVVFAFGGESKEPVDFKKADKNINRGRIIKGKNFIIGNMDGGDYSEISKTDRTASVWVILFDKLYKKLVVEHF